MTKITINVRYEIGEIVYLTTDPEQYKRIITAYQVDKAGILYILACGELQTTHYDFEITTEKELQL